MDTKFENNKSYPIECIGEYLLDAANKLKFPKTFSIINNENVNEQQLQFNIETVVPLVIETVVPLVCDFISENLLKVGDKIYTNTGIEYPVTKILYTNGINYHVLSIGIKKCVLSFSNKGWLWQYCDEDEDREHIIKIVRDDKVMAQFNKYKRK